MKLVPLLLIFVSLAAMAGCGSEDELSYEDCSIPARVAPADEEECLEILVDAQSEKADEHWQSYTEAACEALDDPERCAEAEELRNGEEPRLSQDEKSPSLRRHERELRQLEERCRREPDNPELTC